MSPARRPGSPPLVTVDVAAAYELLHSVVVVLEADESGTYDADAGWLDGLRERAGTDLLDRLRAVCFGEYDTFRHLAGVAYDADAPRDVAAFLDHLRTLDPIELKLHLVQFYTREARRRTSARVVRAAVAGDAEAREEFLRSASPEWEHWTTYLRAVLDADGTQLRDEVASALDAWADGVWKPESLTVMPILERDADAKRELMGTLEIEDFVRTATNGVEFAPRPGVERLVMVPSFFQRPVVSYVEYGEVLMIVYPVADESISADTDTPPLRLVRLSKALGDEKRLRVLRALADGEKSLIELADMFGVAKTTMHHHMIILRSAGLVSVGVGAKHYRLRHETVPDVGALLSGYLGAAPGPSAASRSPASSSRPRPRAAADA
jgi:DNA-binding transcriptional ArsR family regulator